MSDETAMPMQPCGSPGCHCHIVIPAIGACKQVLRGMEVEDVMNTLECVICELVMDVAKSRPAQREMLRTHADRLNQKAYEYRVARRKALAAA
ncbi:hypothetical protein [Aurantimonas sp. NFXS3]|uniref:hypothetical protein n=1 Tax=Aurantimonas sp. NFXS3 TaxID=2818434 RepID=UPI003B8E18FF